MIWRLAALSAALLFFLGNTVNALAQHGYAGFFEAMGANAATRLAMLDLTIVLTLALIWMYADARRRGVALVEWAVYAVVTAGFGAAGPLAYLIRREWSAA
jgi:hypothetical protein